MGVKSQKIQQYCYFSIIGILTVIGLFWYHKQLDFHKIIATAIITFAYYIIYYLAGFVFNKATKKWVKNVVFAYCQVFLASLIIELIRMKVMGPYNYQKALYRFTA